MPEEAWQLGAASQQTPLTNVRAEDCRRALAAALEEAESPGDTGVSVNRKADQLREASGDARQSAAELGALLTLKAPPLQRRTARLSGDVDALSAEAAQLAGAVQRCIQELCEREEALCAFLAEKKGEATRQFQVLNQRRSDLRSELVALEVRLAEPTATSFNGPTWSAVHAERRAALTARIERAAVRQATAAQLSRNATARSKARLAELQQERERQNTASWQAASRHAHGVPRTWRSRFEAFISEQRDQADRLLRAEENEVANRLRQASAAASSAVQEADCSGPSAKLLHGTLRLVQGLADAECRRMALLRARWLEMQGHALAATSARSS